VATVRTMLGVSESTAVILKNLFTVANQVIVSTGSATPAAVTLSANTMLGNAGAGAAALTAAQVRTILGVAQSTATVLLSAFSAADQILVSTGSGAATTLSVPGRSLVARTGTGSGLSVLTPAQDTVVGRRSGDLTDLAAADIKAILANSLTAGNVATTAAAGEALIPVVFRVAISGSGPFSVTMANKVEVTGVSGYLTAAGTGGDTLSVRNGAVDKITDDIDWSGVINSAVQAAEYISTATVVNQGGTIQVHLAGSGPFATGVLYIHAIRVT
jgi:hypothetical protein